MSKALSDLALQFVIAHTSADSFVEEYIYKWQEEGRTRMLLDDPPDVSEVLSTIFCLADQYNPREDRQPDEFDADRLRVMIRDQLRRIGIDCADSSAREVK